jgi:flavin reductase ActVB
VVWRADDLDPQPDSHERPAARDFANAMAELVTGVCVVTAASLDGEPRGMAVTSLCSYSAAPPSVLVCVREGGKSHEALRSARAFGVHVLCHDQEYVARRFAQSGGDKFAEAAWHWDDDVPAIDDVVAYLRCVRVAVNRHGDHEIVIGEVERVETRAKEPLLYLRRRMDWRVEE